jgi:hypothetical protein
MENNPISDGFSETPKQRLSHRRTSRNHILMKKEKQQNLQNFKEKLKNTLSCFTKEMTNLCSNITKQSLGSEVSMLSENNIENHNNSEACINSQRLTLNINSSAISESSDSGISNNNVIISERVLHLDTKIDDHLMKESSPEDFTNTDKKSEEETEEIILEEIIEDIWDVSIRKDDDDYQMKFLVKWDNWYSFLRIPVVDLNIISFFFL